MSLPLHKNLHGEEHVNGVDDIPLVTTSQKGLMSAADKIKLDGLSPGGGGSTDFKREQFTLNGTDISNEYVSLVAVPDDADSVQLIVRGGIPQVKGADWDIDGTFLNRIRWDSLGLSGILAIGDLIEVTYV